MEFCPSKSLTVGAELEFQLLDARSLELADGILPLLELYPNSEYVKPEFIQNTVEIASRPCTSVRELEAHVLELTADLQANAAELGMRMCGAGTHPFCRRHALITPQPRYQQIERNSGYLAHTRITFATHVHVGVADADQMIRLVAELRPYLPLLIGLSANSPFWHGYRTGFVSYRHRALAATGSYGLPPVFEDWDDFCGFMAAAARAGRICSISDIHWDLRPQPELGTVEVRVMDAQTTVAEAMALAALVRSLVAYLGETEPAERPETLPTPLPWWAAQSNHFAASHLGLEAALIDDVDGQTVSLGEQAHRVLDAIEPAARGLAEADYLDRVRERMRRGLGYQRQLRTFDVTDSLELVCQQMSDELSQEQRPSLRV